MSKRMAKLALVRVALKSHLRFALGTGRIEASQFGLLSIKALFDQLKDWRRHRGRGVEPAEGLEYAVDSVVSPWRRDLASATAAVDGHNSMISLGND